MKRRLLSMFLLVMLLLSALAFRLAAIQLIEGSKYRLLAEEQSRVDLSEIRLRGTIYDRENRPLINRDKSYIFLIEDRKMDKKVEELLRKVGARDVDSGNDRYRTYSISTVDRAVFRRLCRDYGALVVESLQRYSENQPAMHLIGYVSAADQLGVCGIERDFDGVLSSVQKQYSAQNDGLGYIIPGRGVYVRGDGREWGVLTTIDMDLQEMADQVLRDSGLRGAVIITDISSGQILASTSAPGYDPYEVGGSTDHQGSELLNKAAGCLYPSEILYRILIAAAALENGLEVPCSSFDCSGSSEPELCRNTWLGIAQLAGEERISETAMTFGLSEEPVALLSGQAKGDFPPSVQVWSPENGNPARPFESYLISPMQAARATRIIASGGWDSRLSLIRGTVEGVRGALLLSIPKKKQVISEETARKLRDMMEETGDFQNWFTGWIRAKGSLYGITVYVEDSVKEEQSAGSLFREIARGLYRISSSS